MDDFYYGLDGTIQYNFIENKTFDPFLGIGGSYNFVDDQGLEHIKTAGL